VEYAFDAVASETALLDKAAALSSNAVSDATASKAYSTASPMFSDDEYTNSLLHVADKTAMLVQSAKSISL